MTRAAQASQSARPSVKTIHWMRGREKNHGEIVALTQRGHEGGKFFGIRLENFYGNNRFIVLGGFAGSVAEEDAESLGEEGSRSVFELASSATETLHW